MDAAAPETEQTGHGTETPEPSRTLRNRPLATDGYGDLLPSMADVITHAATQTQAIAVTRSPVLIGALRRSARNTPAELSTLELVKEYSEPS